MDSSSNGMGTRPWPPGTTKSFGNGWVSVESPSEAGVHYLDHLVVAGVVQLHHSEVDHPVVPGMVLGLVQLRHPESAQSAVLVVA